MNADRGGFERMIPPKDVLERYAIYLLRETGAPCSLGKCDLETPAEKLCEWCKRLHAENLSALREAYAAGVEASAKAVEQCTVTITHPLKMPPVEIGAACAAEIRKLIGAAK